jgi:hypothetical protein
VGPESGDHLGDRGDDRGGARDGVERLRDVSGVGVRVDQAGQHDGTVEVVHLGPQWHVSGVADPGEGAVLDGERTGEGRLVHAGEDLGVAVVASGHVGSPSALTLPYGTSQRAGGVPSAEPPAGGGTVPA